MGGGKGKDDGIIVAKLKTGSSNQGRFQEESSDPFMVFTHEDQNKY